MSILCGPHVDSEMSKSTKYSLIGLTGHLLSLEGATNKTIYLVKWKISTFDLTYSDISASTTSDESMLAVQLSLS